ncbi:MAG: hypothetical protein NTV87_05045 [Ignavibacteriae bacterium]|jgi:chromosome segregation ATPase|nr:hypothetical protein [Ignavibacteriota bacterium]
MDNNKPEISREDLLKLQGVLSTYLDNLHTKVKVLIDKFAQTTGENDRLKESIKELTNKITDLKLQMNKVNSDSVFKDREISELKTMLINTENNKTSVKDKEFVKSRLKELISRIDVHLEQYEGQAQETED